MFREFSQFLEINRLGSSGGSAPACTPYFGHTYTSTLGGHPTFARSSVGTYVDASDGLIKTASANIPRYQTGGLLFEIVGASNYCNYSNVKTSDWSVSDAVFGSAITGLVSGKSTYALIDNTNSYAAAFLSSGPIAADTSTYCASVYILKEADAGVYPGIRCAIGSNGARLKINKETGAIAAYGTDNTLSRGAIDEGLWWRIYFTIANTSATSFTLYVYPTIASNMNAGTIDTNATGTTYFDGVQFEIGTYPTSLINTSGSSAARADESLSYSGISATNETRAVVDLYDGGGFQNIDVDNWDGAVDSNIITSGASPAIVKSIVAYPTGCRPA